MEGTVENEIRQKAGRPSKNEESNQRGLEVLLYIK